MSKYEKTLADLKDYIDGCKRQKLSGNIIVDKVEIDEALNQLEMETPQEIKKYQRIIGNRDAILNEATEKASEIIESAKAEKEQRVSEHEIMQQAYEQAQELVNEASAQAQEILDNAVNDANDIRTSAMQYTDDILADLQNIITHTMENVTARYDSFMKAFNQSLDVIVANRKELAPSQEEVVEPVEENGAAFEELEDAGQEQIEESVGEVREEDFDNFEVDSDYEDYTVDLDN